MTGIIITTLAAVFMISVFYPEISFALFLCAGAFKADPTLAGFSELVDLTLFMAATTIAGIAYQTVRNQFRIRLPQRDIIIPYFIFSMIMLLSLMYTTAPIYGSDKTMRFLLLTTFTLYVPTFIFHRERSFARFMVTFIMFALLLTSSTFVASTGAKKMTYVSGIGEANYLAFGRLAGAAAIMCLFYFYATGTRRIKIIVALSAGIYLIAGLMLSAGRGPVVAFLISMILTTLFVVVINRNFRPAALSSGAVGRIMAVNVVIIISALIAVAFFGSYFERFFLRFEVLSTASGGGSSASTRLSMIKDSMKIITSLPEFLIGTGIGGFSAHYAGYDGTRGYYPHNIILESATEMGVFAALVLCVWFFRSFLKVVTLWSNERYAMVISGLLIFSLINALVSGDFNDNRLLFFSIGVIFSGCRIDL